MDKYEQIVTKLKVMGHPVRLKIIDMLREGEICVCHIERALDKRQAYVSQQLMTLRDAGLVDSRKDGLQVYYRLVDEQVMDLLDLLIGSTTSDELTVLDGCTCPHCSTTHIAKTQ